MFNENNMKRVKDTILNTVPKVVSSRVESIANENGGKGMAGDLGMVM
jgi:hypothetical protein